MEETSPGKFQTTYKSEYLENRGVVNSEKCNSISIINLPASTTNITILDGLILKPNQSFEFNNEPNVIINQNFTIRQTESVEEVAPGTVRPPVREFLPTAYYE